MLSSNLGSKNPNNAHGTSSRGSLCSFSHYICSDKRLEGFDYCPRHILEDKNSPFRQCNYTFSNTGRRCTSAAPKHDKKDNLSRFCPEHCLRTFNNIQKSQRKRKTPDTREKLFLSLVRYAPTEETDSEIGMTEGSGVAASALEYGSDSDEDMIPNPSLDNTWRGDGDSDAESVHSEEEDNVLKHAGVYTAEEVVSITKDKMIRLRKLYEQQYKRLQNQLKESKRKYLVAVKQEKDVLPSIHDCPKDTPEEKQAYEELKALLRYHKLHGKEALLQRNKWLKRQKETEGGNNHRVNVGLRCFFSEGGVRCSTKPLPLSKYCLKHILHDPHQMLYRACGWDNGDNTCLEPVLCLDNEARCLLHTRMEPLPPVAGPSKPNTETKEESPPPSVS